MKLADFAAAYRLYKLDDDRRDTFLDTLKECFDALGVGQQLSFVDVLKKEGQKTPTSETWPVDGSGDQPATH